MRFKHYFGVFLMAVALLLALGIENMRILFIPSSICGIFGMFLTRDAEIECD